MTQPHQILTRAQAASLLAISISTLKRLEKTDPKFPRATLLGLRKIGYPASSVAAFQALQQQRAAKRDRTAPVDSSLGGRAGTAARRAKAQPEAKAAA